MKAHKSEISGRYNDEELLELYAQTGDAEYFGQLYSRYIPLLYGLCLKYLNNQQEAEDAVMGLCENLLQKITDYKIRLFRTWIYSVAKNHCLQLLRKQKTVIEVDYNDAVMESDPTLHLLDEASDQKDRALADCMNKLPENQRTAITLFFIEEMSYADIVEKAGYSLLSVKSYVQNGKRNLKICLEKQAAV